jgi:MraZ protein
VTVPIFHGEHELTVDDKSRLFIPTEVRKLIGPELGEGFFQILGDNRTLWFYPIAVYEDLASKAPPEMIPSTEQNQFDQITFAMASKLKWDKQGRITIPDKTFARANFHDADGKLIRDVTLIGARNHLELWRRTAWEAYREALLNRAAEIALKARQRS